MMTYRGKTALITGASAGIGAVFAEMLAQRGTNLIIVARSEDKLHTLATRLAERHTIQATVIAADLTAPGAAQQLYDETRRRGLSVDILVNNAGFGTHGMFDALSLDRQRDEVQLNVTVLIELTHLFLPAMLAQRDGAIINVASTAAFQPIPYMAIYGATKAFVLSFSEALWAEYRERGIRVLALCPGATDTSFFEVVDSWSPPAGVMSTPESVVKAALKGLEGGKNVTIPGVQNVVSSLLPRLLPRRLVLLVAKRMFALNTSPAGSIGTEGGRSSR